MDNESERGKKTNRPRTASALRFIPYEPREKDTHSINKFSIKNSDSHGLSYRKIIENETW